MLDPFSDSLYHNLTLNGYMSILVSTCEVEFLCPISRFLPGDSDFLISLSDMILLKHNTLMTLLSESRIAQSEFNISEIRQQAGPVILAWLALQRLM